MDTLHATHFLVWIDHDRARVIELIAGETRAIRIEMRASATGPSCDGRRSDPILEMHLFDEVADTIETADQIVLTGPGHERHDLRKYLELHRPSIAAHVIGVEQIGNATDTVLRMFTRTYFRLSDRR